MTEGLPTIPDTRNPPPPTPEGGPWVQYNGQVTTANDVLAKMAELDADPKFQERVKDGDAKAFEERGALWRIAHGMTPTPQAAVNTADVFGEMNARALAETESRAESLRADGISEVGIYEYLNGRPVPLAEHQEAQRQLARLKADKGFQRKLRDNDMDARREWRRVHLNISMPVVSNSVDGKLQPEIAAWEAAHKDRKPK